LADAGTFTVADVVADNDDLVKIATVEEDAGVVIVVDVALADDEVAVALGEMQAVVAVSDEHFANGGLHGSEQLDADRARMAAMHLEAADNGEAFTFPRVRFYAGRSSGALVVTDDAQGGAGAFHENARCAVVAANADKACARQRHNDGLSDAVVAAREFKHTVDLFHGVL